MKLCYFNQGGEKGTEEGTFLPQPVRPHRASFANHLFFSPTDLKCHYYVVLSTWLGSLLIFLFYSGYLFIYASLALCCFKYAFTTKLNYTHTHMISENFLGYLYLFFCMIFLMNSLVLFSPSAMNNILGELHQMLICG